MTEYCRSCFPGDVRTHYYEQDSQYEIRKKAEEYCGDAKQSSL